MEPFLNFPVSTTFIEREIIECVYSNSTLYFFANEEFRSKLKNAFILDEVMGSDHCPIGLEIA